jgi:hypothetical protein
VTIFHRESRLIELQLDAARSQALHEHLSALGVEIRYGQGVRHQAGSRLRSRP